MVSTVGIRESIKSLNDLRDRFNLSQTQSDRFFTEWYENLPELSDREREALERIKRRYDYHRASGLLLEGTVNVVVVSALLEAAGFLDAPFTIRSPQSVKIEIEDADETITGLIDILVVQEQLWVLVVESKRTGIPVPSALPQILAYMMANARKDRPTFGMATNGDGFVFIKLDHKTTAQYDVSREFSLFPRRHELYEVLRILKRLGEIAIA
jgi:hypothetical protein